MSESGPANASDVDEKPDDFASVALKVQFLVGVSSGASVLLAGPHFASHRDDFERAFGSVDVLGGTDGSNASESDGEYDLICLDVRNRWHPSGTRALIVRFARCLAPNGVLVLAAGNRNSLDRIIKRVKAPTCGAGSDATPRLVRETLRRAGLGVVRQFFAFPSLASPDEYWSVDADGLALPSYNGRVHHLAQRIGAFGLVHDDSLFIASRDAVDPVASLIRALTEPLTTSERWQGPVRLERFGLRQRGASVFVLLGTSGGIVARVALSTRVAARVRRNDDFTSRVHALPSFAPRLKSLVPRTLGRFEREGAVVFVEPLLSGVLAWKLAPGGGAAQRTKREAIEFIDALGRCTGALTEIDEATFQRLIGADLDAVRGAFPTLSGARGAINRIREHLRSRLVGAKAEIVWGHGDFGFGNLLADAVTGELQGVIDWDTHVVAELAGVDQANLLLQLHSAASDGDLANAMRIMSRESASGDRTAIAFAGIRMISRSVHYIREFRDHETSYEALLVETESLLRGDSRPVSQP